MVDQLAKDRKHNLKIYSIYRSMSLDLIFYYVIEFLFLTQEKGISESGVVLGYSFYAISKIIVQIPINHIINMIGNKKSMIIANIFILVFVFLIMYCPNIYTLLLAEFICAIGYSFKEVADFSLLKASIPESKDQSNIYAKLEERGFKNYYLINAITSAIAGSLYILNSYLPLIGCATFMVLSLIISFAFKDINIEEKNEKRNTKKYLKEMKEQSKFILKSPRLRCLFIYIGLITGIINILTTYKVSLLVDLNVEDQYITMIIAAIGIACSRGSEKQNDFCKKFKNKSFSVIIVTMSTLVFLLGICGKYFNKNVLSISIIIMMLIALGFMQGIHNVINSKYLSNFTDENILSHIISVKEVIKYALTAVISLIGSFLLNYKTTAESMIILGIDLLIIGIILIIYMKPRFGLNPEEYTKKDIYDRKYIH